MIAALVSLALVLLVPCVARGADPFESLYCFRYAEIKGYPVDAILFGTDRGKTMDLPFVLCVAKRG